MLIANCSQRVRNVVSGKFPLPVEFGLNIDAIKRLAIYFRNNVGRCGNLLTYVNKPI